MSCVSVKHQKTHISCFNLIVSTEAFWWSNTFCFSASSLNSKDQLVAYIELIASFYTQRRIGFAFISCAFRG